MKNDQVYMNNNQTMTIDNDKKERYFIQPTLVQPNYRNYFRNGLMLDGVFYVMRTG
jgi:hypothetical protein